MKKTASIVALLLALGSPAFAQGTAAAPAAAPAAGTKDPSVQMRNEQAAAKKDYKQKKSALDADRKAKISAMVDEELKGSAAKAKDQPVARRDAEAKAKKATQADYDAKLKALKAERKAALDAIAKKYPNAAKSQSGGG